MQIQFHISFVGSIYLDAGGVWKIKFSCFPHTVCPQTMLLGRIKGVGKKIILCMLLICREVDEGGFLSKLQYIYIFLLPDGVYNQRYVNMF